MGSLTHQYGSACASPGLPPSRTGHHTDRRQRLWHPLKQRGGSYLIINSDTALGKGVLGKIVQVDPGGRG